MNKVLSMEEYLTSNQIEFQQSKVDGFGNSGQYTVYPTNEEALRELFVFINHQHLTVNIQGAGSKRGYGGLIDQADVLISMDRFTGIVEHQSGDMTLTVKAGTKITDIQKYLKDYRQKLALDPFLPNQSTIGGVVASNDSGPKRLSYGSARDAVIGLRVVYPNGQIIRTGGKVVKNVAGYDMNKLFISSMGTLGVITEVTLKLRPMAKHTATCLITFQHEKQNHVLSFCQKLLNSHIEPVCCELLDPVVSKRIGGKQSLSLLICFEDVEKSVTYQIEYLQSLLEDDMEMAIKRGEEEQQLWDDMYQLVAEDLLHKQENQKIFAVAKIGTINLNVIDIIYNVMEIKREKQINIYIHGGVGQGLMQLYVEGNEREIIETLTNIRELAKKYDGYCVVKHLPLAQRLLFDVWGETKGTQFLLEGIKGKIDPNRILNRKRYIGGI